MTTATMTRIQVNEDGSITLEPEATVIAQEMNPGVPFDRALRLYACHSIGCHNRLLRDRRTARQFWIDQGYIDGREPA